MRVKTRSAVCAIALIAALLSGCGGQTAQTGATESEGVDTTQEESQTWVSTDYGPEHENKSIFDLDNMTFSANGTIITVGKSTLQDLIDAGVPFDDFSSSAFDTVVKPYFTQGFAVDLVEHLWSHGIEVCNYSESDLPARECTVRSLLYRPAPDATHIPNLPEDVFDPLIDTNLSLEDFLAKYGEPAFSKHSDSVDTPDLRTDYDTSDTLYYLKYGEGQYDDSCHSGYVIRYEDGKVNNIVITVPYPTVYTK